MSTTIHDMPTDQSVRQNLWWLMILRNLILGGITCLLMITVHVLKYQIPSTPLWTIIAVLWVINSISWLRLQHPYPVREVELFLHLIIDVIGITTLLYHTGGAANPVAWFFLVPLIITATILPQKYTWYMVGLTSLCYTLLIIYNIPLPDFYDMSTRPELPAGIMSMQHRYIHNLYVLVMWGGFLVVAAFVAYFVVEMADTIRDSDLKLADAREQALRNERLIAMGTLAASAAHEMGTPLGTMAIVVGELEREYRNDENEELYETMQILHEQVDRCKTALAVMAESAGELQAVSGKVMNVTRYLDELSKDWHENRQQVVFERVFTNRDQAPDIIADRTLTHALINVLDNSADLSPKWVGLHVDWDQEHVYLEISDHGPGFSKEIVDTLGEAPTQSKKMGLGVGLFLTKAIIERLGGSIQLGNSEQGGALIKIILPTVRVSQTDTDY